MTENRTSSISQSRTLEEMAEFWDTRSLADYDDQTYEVEMTFAPSARRSFQPSLSPAEAARLKQLNHAAGERSLTQAEVSEQAALLEAYHLSVLRRAQALAILAQRGHAIPYRTSLEARANGQPSDF